MKIGLPQNKFEAAQLLGFIQMLLDAQPIWQNRMRTVATCARVAVPLGTMV